MNCEHCNSILSSLSNLNYHKLHNKKCLIKQGLNKNSNISQFFSCTLCIKKFTTKNSLIRHRCLKKELEIYKNEVNLTLEIKNKEIETYIKELKKENEVDNGVQFVPRIYPHPLLSIPKGADPGTALSVATPYADGTSDTTGFATRSDLPSVREKPSFTCPISSLLFQSGAPRMDPLAVTGSSALEQEALPMKSGGTNFTTRDVPSEEVNLHESPLPTHERVHMGSWYQEKLPSGVNLEIYRNEIRVSNERTLKLEIELKNKELEIEITKKELERYKIEKEIQKREIEKLDIHVERLENKLADLASQSVNKPTKFTSISNTTNNFNLIPLDIGHKNNIKDIVENHYNLEYQLNGQKGLAKLLSDSGVLKPKGDNIYVCSDSSRGIFKYKNENGIEIRDIQAKDLISWIQPIAEKNIKKEGLQRVSDLFECICSSETIETAQPFATEQSKLIEAHTSIVNMNDDNKEFVRALGVCI